MRPPELPSFPSAPPRGPVLVVAPHPDDEIIGPGGTLLLHVAQGDPVSIVTVFDGAQGDPGGKFPREGYAARRAAETARVADEWLGGAGVTALGFPDGLGEEDVDKVFGGLPSDPEEKRRALVAGLASRLEARVEAARPRTVYYPWSGEFHPDHWVTGAAFESLVANRPDLLGGVDVMGYEVWSTLLAETVVDVTAVIERKLDAIRSYETQCAYVDYAEVIRGLNLHRGTLLPGNDVRFGEAFRGRYSESGT